MRAFEIQEGFGLDSLRLTERPEPRPGSHQVLIKLRAASLNFRDLMAVKGLYNPKMVLPRIPLSDGSGEVVAVGDGVTRVKPGDRVAGIFMQSWLSGGLAADGPLSALGDAIDGMLTEHALLNEEGVVHIPGHLSFEEAATLPCAAVTAWNALVTRGGVKAGDTVLVLGTGGLSLFALQFARLFGARVILTSSSDEKLERGLNLGASDVINYKNVLDWDERVLELTDGRGVDHIIEVGGAGTFNKSLRAVRTGGFIAVIGLLSGRGGDIDNKSIIMKGLRMQGIHVGSRQMFEEMNRAINLHRMRPVIDRVFSFEEALDAFRYFESRAHFGKVVLHFADGKGDV